MKLLLLPILIFFLPTTLVFAQDAVTQASPQYQEEEITDEMLYADIYVLILKSTKDYNEAVNFATEASKELGLEFDNEDRKYSEENGIYFSEDINDVMYRGGYFPRRYKGEFISLENSDCYKDFTAGYIIVISGIYADKESADTALSRVKEFYKDAYVKKTVIWMGCIH